MLELGKKIGSEKERHTERQRREQKRRRDCEADGAGVGGGKKTFFFFLEEFCPDSAAVGSRPAFSWYLLEKLQNCSSPVRTRSASSSPFLSAWRSQTAGLRYSPTNSALGQEKATGWLGWGGRGWALTPKTGEDSVCEKDSLDENSCC